MYSKRKNNIQAFYLQHRGKIVFIIFGKLNKKRKVENESDDKIK